jgi:hypothetical protein
LTLTPKKSSPSRQKRTISEDRYPPSPRVKTLKAILAKLEPPTVAAEPLPTSKPRDRPRAALAAMEKEPRLTRG